MLLLWYRCLQFGRQSLRDTDHSTNRRHRHTTTHRQPSRRVDAFTDTASDQYPSATGHRHTAGSDQYADADPDLDANTAQYTECIHSNTRSANRHNTADSNLATAIPYPCHTDSDMEPADRNMGATDRNPCHADRHTTPDKHGDPIPDPNGDGDSNADGNPNGNSDSDGDPDAIANPDGNPHPDSDGRPSHADAFADSNPRALSAADQHTGSWHHDCAIAIEHTRTDCNE